jgi:hypothetical protein
MCHTGSFWPFRIRAATLWPLDFYACTFTPRGGPRSEPPRPGGFRPISSSLYLRAEQFIFIPFSALALIPEHFEPFAPCFLVAAGRRQSLTLDELALLSPPR